MQLPSLTLIVSGLFVAYIGHSMWTIYGLFSPTPCAPGGNCLHPFTASNPKVELLIYASRHLRVDSISKMDLVAKFDNFSIHEEYEKTVNVTIPRKTRNNGTLHCHIFLVPAGREPFTGNHWHSYGGIGFTTYAVQQASTYNLVGDSQDIPEQKVPPAGQSTPISHWRTQLTVSVMNEDISFDTKSMPSDLYRFMRQYQGHYLPILYVDELATRTRDLWPINATCKQMPLLVKYRPISIGKLRMWVNMQEAMRNLHSLGFSEKDTDEVKGIFADTNFYFLMLTFIVAAFHLLFDFLAFKNDISYWKRRENMIGLSSRTVVWRCVSTFVIFLYLMDENTSLLVLIPAGIGTLIELWKVSKAFKVSIKWTGFRPSCEFGSSTDKERETQEFDSQAMTYLSYLLYPLCIGGAIYSLIYTPHKSWYSWCINSMVNGVYAFGFLFMLPQLFVNYKLKSVAHLPWRAFMYKAFNTFIDDVFAFIITMPTAHRLACFRDDIVFLLYLYQRWLYPVDKKRINEYGQSFEEESAADGQTKKQVKGHGQSSEEESKADGDTKKTQ